MYELSLYTHIFSRNSDWFIYNSQSNFFIRVSRDLVNVIEGNDWTALDDETLKLLQKQHVIELKGHQHDYFDLQQLKFTNRNYRSTSMVLVIAPTTACNFNCPYCFEPKLSPKFMTQDTFADLKRFIRGYPDVK